MGRKVGGGLWGGQARWSKSCLSAPKLLELISTPLQGPVETQNRSVTYS